MGVSTRSTREAKLGEGAFGKVIQAEQCGLASRATSSTTVAVKMLKEGHSDDEVKDFVCELEIMKMIGKHPNIINLLGCCCANGPLLVIVEFAPHGNLLDFLRKFHAEKNPLKSLSVIHMIYFAVQIAQGMECLASRKCIHRDLATRNVLIGDGYVMKISDFGLARDIKKYEYYRKIVPSKLPMRWMAPEALEHQYYTSQSDGWSFGVLLWEIFTFGDFPYRVWEKFIEELKQGQ